MSYKNKEYKKLEIVVKLCDEYYKAFLLLDKKEEIINEKDITTIKIYNNIEIITPYIEINNEIDLINKYDNILPLSIFEKTYRVNRFNYFDYDEFNKSNIGEIIINYFKNSKSIYERTISNIIKYCDRCDYSDREFEEAIIQYVNRRLKEINNIKEDLLEIFILYSILNPDYIEIYSAIYNYIK